MLDLAESLGIGVKSHSSSIEEAQADRARRKADQLGIRREAQPEEPDTKKKAAKKAAPAEAEAPARPEPAPAPAGPEPDGGTAPSERPAAPAREPAAAAPGPTTERTA